MKRNFAKDNPEKLYQNDYHEHIYYPKIYMYLVIAMFITLIPDFIHFLGYKLNKDYGNWIIIGIFTFSTIKASLVLSKFMHIQSENKMIFFVFVFCLILLFTLYALLYFDISHINDPNAYFSDWYNPDTETINFVLDYEKFESYIKH